MCLWLRLLRLTRADLSLLIGCSMVLATKDGAFNTDLREVAGEEAFLSIGIFLAWFNLLKYFEWSTKACRRV